MKKIKKEFIIAGLFALNLILTLALKQDIQKWEWIILYIIIILNYITFGLDEIEKEIK